MDSNVPAFVGSSVGTLLAIAQGINPHDAGIFLVYSVLGAVVSIVLRETLDFIKNKFKK